MLSYYNQFWEIKPEPFDWFSNEKPVDIPFFECPPTPPFPYKADDVKPSTAPTYAVPATGYDAAGYPQLEQQQYPSPANVYESYPTSLLYSPPSEHAQSPLPPVPTHLFAGARSNVKVESHDPLSMSPAAPASCNAEWLKGETLTPPESPRDEEILKMLEEFEPEALERLMLAPACGEVFASPAPTLVDELSCGSPSAYSDDGASPYTVSSASPYSASPYATSDDADWTPDAQLPSAHSDDSSKRPGEDGAKRAGAVVARRRAGKPYSKPGVEERRLRKKEQNKNAATRYRLKKKAEVEEVKLEENQLLDHNVELKKQLEEVSREVRYLKSLMREAYRKTGLIK